MASPPLFPAFCPLTLLSRASGAQTTCRPAGPGSPRVFC